MMEEIITKITVAILTALKEKKISTIQAVKNQTEKKKTARERFKTKQWFYLNEGSFYKHLTDIVKGTDENSKPKFKNKYKVLGRRNTATTTKDELQEFGSPIWENASEKLTRRARYEAWRQLCSNI